MDESLGFRARFVDTLSSREEWSWVDQAYWETPAGARYSAERHNLTGPRYRVEVWEMVARRIGPIPDHPDP